MSLSKKQVNEVAALLSDMSKAFYNDDNTLKLLIELRLVMSDTEHYVTNYHLLNN